MSYRTRLQARENDVGRPLRVGLVGSGQMGRGFAAQLLKMPGISLAAVFDVDRARAIEAFEQAGIKPSSAHDTDTAARAIENGESVAMGGVDEIGAMPLDIVVEATGVPDVGARCAIETLAACMDFATLNVEQDVTVGRYMLHLANQSKGLYSVCRGDEPIETKILVDFARDLNFEIICAGKGKNNPLNPYATPDDLAAEAARKKMNPKMLTEFVDGSKAMIEMAALANTTGLEMSKRGMYGPASDRADVAPHLRPTRGRRGPGPSWGRGLLHRAGLTGRIRRRTHR
ncbi:MAG: hypothetical protein V9E81_16675 [Marmoricola sp.]